MNGSGPLHDSAAATRPVCVTDIRNEADDICSFVLEGVDATPLPVPTPGAHIDVHLGSGLTRQYSLCNGPDETTRYQIAVKLELASRGGSRHMHSLQKGDRLEISEPRNAFPLKPGATQTLLLAGGIGVTPLISMAKHLAGSGHPFHLHNFTRSVEASAFRDVLRGPVLSPNTTFHHGLDPAGVRNALERILLPAQAGAELYFCGPAPFMTQVQDVVAGRWSDAAVHWESFTASAIADGAEFVLSLRRSGKTVTVGPDERIVDAAARCGVNIATSCEQGICGTCIVRVVEGVPDHRDMILTDEERAAGTQICSCVSRSHTAVLGIDL